MRRLALVLILFFSGCAIPDTPWVQTWADPIVDAYKGEIVQGQLEVFGDYKAAQGAGREIVEVIYFVRSQIPWSGADYAGYCSWSEDEATIYLAVHRQDWRRIWRHELHHARIGDPKHTAASWADLRKQ